MGVPLALDWDYHERDQHSIPLLGERNKHYLRALTLRASNKLFGLVCYCRELLIPNWLQKIICNKRNLDLITTILKFNYLTLQSSRSTHSKEILDDSLFTVDTTSHYQHNINNQQKPCSAHGRTLNWMAWCKTDLSDFFGWFFCSSRVPEFLLVLFNLKIAENSLICFLGWFALCFSEKQGQNIEACTMNWTKQSKSIFICGPLHHCHIKSLC